MGKIPERLRDTIARNIRDCRMKKFPGRGGGKICAEAFGVSQQQWSPWERGRRTPDELRLQQIAEFFGVTVAYLREDHRELREDDGAFLNDMPRPESEPYPPHQPMTPPHTPHFHCPFYLSPQPGQPSGMARSKCWLAERILDDLRMHGLPIRLYADDVDKVIKRYFQLRYPSQ